MQGISTRSTRRWSAIPWTVAISLALLCAQATLGDTLRLVGDDLVFAAEPTVGSEIAGLELTVTGPGGLVYQASVDDADTFAVSVWDVAGPAVADGTYTWELRLRPALDDALRAELSRARERGDDAVVRAFRVSVGPTVWSGSFAVREGQVLVPRGSKAALEAVDMDEEDGGPEKIEDTTLVARDQVVSTDLIVDGSLCAGTDCVNGESFGTDTVRLRENNLRLRFLDSSASNFPTNDWRLVANDSASAGAEYFAIEDAETYDQIFRLDAGAPENSLRVGASGRVGIGTANPLAELHVVDGDTATLRLEQHGAGGFVSQAYAIESNELGLIVRDVTNGSERPFRISPGAGTWALVVASSSDVGVGTVAPADDLHVHRTDAQDVFVRVESGNGTVRNTGVRLVNSEAEWTMFNRGTGGLRFSSDLGAALDISADGKLRIFENRTGTNAGVPACFDIRGNLCECGYCE